MCVLPSAMPSSSQSPSTEGGDGGRGGGWGGGGGGGLGQHVLHLTSSWHFDLRPLTGVNRAPCFHNWRLLSSLGF